jgi:uncharacterized protein
MVAGERLVLLPERAILWPRASTLLVADPHWGKAAAFRAAGLPVPEATTLDGIRRIEGIIHEHGPERIVYLGDYLHAASGRAAGTLRALEEMRRRLGPVEQLLVRGNHDRGAGDPPPELGVRCMDAPLHEPPFSFRHHPAADPAGYVLAGHLHPAIRLTGRGRQRERLPCFHIGERCLVLPAFGDFTGFADVRPAEGDRIFVIAERHVLPIRLPGLDGWTDQVS